MVTEHSDFIPVKVRLPAEGERIDWITPGGDQINDCRYERGLWWILENLYVYYTPLSWRPALLSNAGS